MLTLSMRIYMLTVLYASIRQTGLKIRALEDEHDKVEIYAVEICRTYAGLEEYFEDDSRAYSTCFKSLVMAGFACPKELRLWLWHKLAHFEQLGPRDGIPIKRNLAVIWDMPELLTHGFSGWKSEPLQNRGQDLRVEDIELAAEAGHICSEDDPISGSDIEDLHSPIGEKH